VCGTETIISVNVLDSEQGSKPSLQKVPVLCEVGSAHRISFTADSSRAVVATSAGDIAVIQLGADELPVLHVFHPLQDKRK
jgi:hypothetical protein